MKRRSLRGLWLSLLTQIVIAGPPVWALCPGGPLFSEVVNNDPMLLQACGGGGQCTVPARPTILTGDPFNGPQSYRVQATIPQGLQGVTSARWIAEYKQPTTQLIGVWYTGETIEGFQTPKNGGETITSVLPGLVSGTTTYFKVAFCVDDDCTCWSDRSLGEDTPSFSTSLPKPPGSVDLEVEDDFRRPATSPKFQPANPTVRAGDGLGPWQENPSGASNLRGIVWVDGVKGVAAGNGSRIHTDQERAFLPVNAAPCYGREATHEHAYAEALFELDPNEQDDLYNFDVRSRVHFNDSVLRGYFVKLAHGFVGADSPTLRIGRFEGMNPINKVDLEMPTSDPADKCDEAPPLARTGGQRVWLRTEVFNTIGPQPHPKVVATAAWGNCSANQPIDQCEHVCMAEFEDFDPIGGEFLEIEGMWGMFAHERNYFLDLFRAGSEPQ